MNKLKKIYDNIIFFINIPRSIPIFIIYFLLENKDSIKADMKRDITLLQGITLYPMMMKNQYMRLHFLMVYSYIFRNIFCMRLRENSSFLVKLITIFYKIKVDCGLISKFGPGLSICHGNSSIIFAQEIGENFTVYQQVTIGRGKKVNDRDIAIIGDNCIVYAGAKIIGGITIGNNCIIGAGAVVTKDIPSNCTVIGNPAIIIKKDGKKVYEKL